MDSFKEVTENKFIEAVFTDARSILKNTKSDLSDTTIADDVVLDEYQFYLQGVGFHLAHALTWFRQLNVAVELLTNFDYSKRLSASRADHLIYNVENYLIRLNSAYDRTLQLTNSVFHICIHEEHVSHSIITSNIKVKHRPIVVAKLKALKKFLDSYAQERHAIIHKHSLLDKKLRRIELFYNDELLIDQPQEWKDNLKLFRANYLREYVIEKKSEFASINTKLSKHFDEVLSALLVEYNAQKEIFEARGF